MTDAPMTYAHYLALDDILSAQHPLSELDDEMLFIIIHQTKELWLKQMIRELRLAQADIRNDALVPAYKALARVSRIQAV
ncbi:MAG TPA: tryptophan 2,3-dioxygenase family protein, partial [Sphingorhabdus sp.]|nr:tryptophan 2,3-dioxygenase family protein [Sphingorhabdus sp.]